MLEISSTNLVATFRDFIFRKTRSIVKTFLIVEFKFGRPIFMRFAIIRRVDHGLIYIWQYL